MLVLMMKDVLVVVVMVMVVGENKRKCNGTRCLEVAVGNKLGPLARYAESVSRQKRGCCAVGSLVRLGSEATKQQ